MQDAQKKEAERKRKERENPNPFFDPTQITRETHYDVTLSEELWEGAAGTYEVTTSLDESVPLTNVVAAEEDESQDDDHTSTVTLTNSQSSNTAEMPPSSSAAAISPSSFNFFRPRTAFGVAFQSGTLNQPNPRRDYVWGSVFLVAGMGCMVGGMAHGNVPLLMFGLAALLVGMYLLSRAKKAEQEKSSTIEQDVESPFPVAGF